MNDTCMVSANHSYYHITFLSKINVKNENHLWQSRQRINFFRLVQRNVLNVTDELNDLPEPELILTLPEQKLLYLCQKKFKQ